MTLSTDGWTSRIQDHYITVNAHYLTEMWQPVTVNLTTEVMRDRETADNVGSRLEEVAEEWGIGQKITAIVTDNARNMVRAIEHLNVSQPNDVTCSAHTLQLAIRDGLNIPKIKEVCGKASKIVAHFHHSHLAQNQLSKRQEVLGLQKKKLIQSCVTRWNSTYFMLESLQKNRTAVVSVISDRSITNAKVAKRLEFTEEDWTLIEKLIPALQPLQLATEVFCDAKNPLSVVRPVIFTLVEQHFTDIEGDESLDCEDDRGNAQSTIREFGEKIASELKRRFNLECVGPNNVVVPEARQIASALDPR